MTLSNFDWTDKKSVKWFIMLPTGHEGPYSLEALLAKNLDKNIQLWAEGLTSPIALKIVETKTMELASDGPDIPPPLPPLPEKETIPPLPQEPIPSEEVMEETVVPVKKGKVYAVLFIVIILMLGMGVREWLGTQEKISLRRFSKMDPDLFKRISSEIRFEGWDKKIFFKEYLATDMSHIWFITSGFQTCQVEAQFNSLPGKLLSEEDEKISFKSSAVLKDHVAEFSTFDFLTGSRITPGLYEVDIKARNCDWDGIVPRIANSFQGPDKDYIGRMKVILYPKGSVEFNQVLDKLIRKRMEQELLKQNKENLFWEDLQQKLQTLLAITLQIEQLLGDFLDEGPAGFRKNLKPTVDLYTKKFGHTLTNFVVANEEYFKNLHNQELTDLDKKSSYESLVRITAKNIGFESMKLIEGFQSLKRPGTKKLKSEKDKVRKVFEGLKENINQKIIKVTEDRSA